MKPVNQKAWLLILPVVVCVAFSAILPLMTVVNYSVQDIISPERRVFVGTEWFASVMRDEDLHAALWRQLTFSLAVLAVEIPLGIALAQGETLEAYTAAHRTVAEGVNTARAAAQLARKHSVELPISEQVCAVLFEGKPPKQGVTDLMERTLKTELWR